MADKASLVFCFSALITLSLACNDYVNKNASIGDVVTLPCKDGIFWKRGASSICDLWFAGEHLSKEEDGSLRINGVRYQSNLFLNYLCGDSEDFGMYICQTKSGQTIRARVFSKDDNPLQTKIALSLIGIFFCLLFLHLLVSVVRATYSLKSPKKSIRFKVPDHERCSCSSSKCCSGPTCSKNGCFWRLKNWVTSTHNRNRFKIARFFVLNIILCFVDVLTDVYQAVIHYFNDRYLWFGLTISFIFLPFVLSVIIQCSILVRRKCKPTNGQGTDFLECFLHLPIVNLYKHFLVFKEIREVQKKMKEKPGMADLPDDHKDKINHQNYLKKYNKDIAGIQSQFQKFKVIEAIGENTPQAVLQIGIILKDVPTSRLVLFTNPTIVTSVLGMVITFTGLYLKMPFGKTMRSETNAASNGNEAEMQRLDGERGNKKKQDPNADVHFPYKIFKSNIVIMPIILATLFPRVCNLALMLTFDQFWIMIIVYLGLLGINSVINFLVSKKKKWWESDMYSYSIILSIVTPCVRLYPRPHYSILWSSISSWFFHAILLLVMYLLMEFYPSSLNSCGNNEIYINLCLISFMLLLASLIFSMILVAFSADSEFWQLVGLLGWPSAAPLSCPPIDVYKTAVEKKWINVLKCLIQADIDRLKGKDPSSKLKKVGRINWPLKKGRTVVHKVCEAPRSKKNGKSKTDNGDDDNVGNKGMVALAVFLQAPARLGHFDTEDSNGQTPLHVACSEGPVEVVKLIIENGEHLAQINHEDKRKKTPLMIACEKNRLDVVQLFLDHLPDAKFEHLNYVNSMGETALYLAVQRSKVDLVELFLRSNQGIAIDLGAKVGHGQNIWHLMAKKNNEKNVALMDLIVQIKGNLNQELYINDEDKDGRTPYLVSCTAGRELAFQWFLKNANKLDIDLKKKDKEGLDGYALACKYKANNAIIEFLKRGAYGKGETRDRGRKSFEILIGDEVYEIEAKVDAKGNPTKVRTSKLFTDRNSIQCRTTK